VYIKLDPLHRLVFDAKLNVWIMYTCKRVAPYDDVKYKEHLKKNKPIVVLSNNAGEKAFAVWKRGKNCYSPSHISGALMEWVYSVLKKRHNGRELLGSDVIKLLDDIKETISNVVLMSNILDVNISFNMIPKSELAKRSDDEIVRRDREKAKLLTRRSLKNFVGPETVFSATVVDNATSDAVVRHEIEVDDITGMYSVEPTNKDELSNSIAKPRVVDIVSGSGTIINVGDMVLKPGKKGRGGMFRDNNVEEIVCTRKLSSNIKTTAKKRKTKKIVKKKRAEYDGFLSIK
jgi:hypothetical protein